MESFPSETRNPSDCIDFDVYSQAIINTEPPSVVLFPTATTAHNLPQHKGDKKKVGKHRKSRRSREKKTFCSLLGFLDLWLFITFTTDVRSLSLIEHQPVNI